MVQGLTKKLGLLLGDPPDYGRGKECDCVVLMLAHLYNYRVGDDRGGVGGGGVVSCRAEFSD